MQFQIPTYGVPFTLAVDIKTNSPETIRLTAKNTNIQLPTYYANHKGIVNGNREFLLMFPQVPPNLVIDIVNNRNKSDSSFSIEKFQAIPLNTYPIFLSERDRSFIKFCKFFCENASYFSASQFVNGKEVPSIYSSDDGMFTIAYYDDIKGEDGKILNTPARVSHGSGRIEAAKNSFLKYTINMRMIILLHEYSHRWKNPENGLQIGSETGADIAALLMYLSLSYSPVEAHQAFLYVFRGANNSGNHKRYLIIKDFISKFYNGQLKEFAKAA